MDSQKDRSPFQFDLKSEKPSVYELLQQASVEQDGERLRELMKTIAERLARGESSSR